MKRVKYKATPRRRTGNIRRTKPERRYYKQRSATTERRKPPLLDAQVSQSVTQILTSLDSSLSDAMEELNSSPPIDNVTIREKLKEIQGHVGQAANLAARLHLDLLGLDP